MLYRIEVLVHGTTFRCIGVVLQHIDIQWMTLVTSKYGRMIKNHRKINITNDESVHGRIREVQTIVTSRSLTKDERLREVVTYVGLNLPWRGFVMAVIRRFPRDNRGYSEDC